MTNLKECINLGPTIIKNLKKVEITSLEDIKSVGPSEIYLRLKNKYPDKTWPVCYYLYSLEGALKNKHWDDIGNRRKSQLLKQIGR